VQHRLLDLQTRALKMLVHLGPSPGGLNGLGARFVPPNHLIYRPALEPGARSAPALRVIGFDLRRLETVGTPTAIDEPVFITDFGGYADYDVALNGTLVYVPATRSFLARRLAWVQRDGTEAPIDLPARAYTYPISRQMAGTSRSTSATRKTMRGCGTSGATRFEG